MESTKSTQSNRRFLFIVIAVSFALALVFDGLFYGKMPPGISAPLFTLCLVFVFFVLSRKERITIGKPRALFIVLALFFATMVFVRASPLLTFLNIIATLVLLLFVAETLFSKSITYFILKDYLITVFALPFHFLTQALFVFGRLLHFTNGKRKLIGQIIKGVVMAIPALFVLAVLFSSADEVFYHYLTQAINIDALNIAFVQRISVLVIAFLILTGAYDYTFRDARFTRISPRLSKRGGKGMNAVTSAVFLGLINALFLTFIVIQAVYLFGGKRVLILKNLTYAEYARQGFFELIVTAVIVFAILWLHQKIAVRLEAHHALSFKVLAGALIAQVILVLVSAFTRLQLYEAAFGFTTMRLYSHVFIIWLACVFALLLFMIVRDSQEERFAFVVFNSVFLFLGVLNVVNPDAFIARQNIRRYEKTGDLDVMYVTRLSTDAVGEIERLIGESVADDDVLYPPGFKRGELVAFDAQLYYQWQHLKHSQKRSWQSSNVSRSRALRVLNAHARELVNAVSSDPSQNKGY